MSRTAKLFGYEEEYKYYKNEAEKIKAAINNKYSTKKPESTLAVIKQNRVCHSIGVSCQKN